MVPRDVSPSPQSSGRAAGSQHLQRVHGRLNELCKTTKVERQRRQGELDVNYRNGDVKSSDPSLRAGSRESLMNAVDHIRRLGSLVVLDIPCWGTSARVTSAQLSRTTIFLGRG